MYNVRQSIRRGDADFRAGVHVDAAVGFARDGAADDVADRERGVAARFVSRKRGQRVGRFAALRDARTARCSFRSAHCGSEIRCAYSTSTGIAANSSIRYSPTSAACQLVPQAVMTMRSIDAQFCRQSDSGRRTSPCAPSRSMRPRKRVLDRARLLEDFLEHEVRDARRARRPPALNSSLLIWTLRRVRAEIVTSKRSAVMRGHVVVVQINDLASCARRWRWRRWRENVRRCRCR